MAISTYLAGKLLDHFLGNSAYTMPVAWLALCTGSPGDTAAGAAPTNEVTTAGGTNYARVDLTTLFTTLSPLAKTSANTSTITFNTAGASWGTVQYFAICDAQTVGTGKVLWSDQLSVFKTVSTNDTLSFSVGNLSLSFS